MTDQDDDDKCCELPDCCSMKGMLRFLIMWILSKKPMYGLELAEEIGKRRGDTPTAGTIYPALKELTKYKIIEAKTEGKQKIYSLTDRGKDALEQCRAWFVNAFGDVVQEGS